MTVKGIYSATGCKTVKTLFLLYMFHIKILFNMTHPQALFLNCFWGKVSQGNLRGEWLYIAQLHICCYYRQSCDYIKLQETLKKLLVYQMENVTKIQSDTHWLLYILKSCYFNQHVFEELKVFLLVVKSFLVENYKESLTNLSELVRKFNISSGYKVHSITQLETNKPK